MISLEEKRIANISEYILQVYQAEDLIRNLQFDLEKLFEENIEGLSGSNEEKEAEKQWYVQLAKEMKNDSVEAEGHVNRLTHIVKELSEIHFHLLKSDRGYRGRFDQAKLHINRYLQAYGGEPSNPIQICLDGILLYKRKRGNQLAMDDLEKEGMQAFVELCGHLSYRYKAKHEGE